MGQHAGQNWDMHSRQRGMRGMRREMEGLSEEVEVIAKERVRQHGLYIHCRRIYAARER